MSKYVIDSSTLTSIADAVRTKGGTTDHIVVSDIPTAITNLPSGGGDISEEDLTFTAKGDMYLFNKDYNKIYEKNISRIKFVPITNSDGKKYYFLNYLCNDSNIKDLSPITIDCNGIDAISFYFSFNSCDEFEKFPKIINSLNTKLTFSLIVANGSNYLREDEILKFLNYFDKISIWIGQTSTTNTFGQLFNRCYGVIDSSSIFSKIHYMINNNVNSDFKYFRPQYKSWFPYTKAIENFPLPYRYNFDITSNVFSDSGEAPFSKSLTFATDNGLPYQMNMKNQVIDLTGYYTFGYNKYLYSNDYSEGTNYWKVENNIFNSYSMTIELAQERYNLLKNQEDWYSASDRSVNYNGKSENIAKLFSRYNHDSAVETINSLPDTSAYLATAGGTNTIKFEGTAGALTDGGAINTLTEEEIAVAAAKGWTVTLV